MAVDWSDPCARAAALRNAYYALISGQQEQEIRTRTLDAEETVRFTAANQDKLLAELRAAEAACAGTTSGGTGSSTGRRFAITAGGIRRCW